VAVALAASLALAAFACGASSTGPTGAAGTLTVMLQDSPFSDAKALLVTFSEVSVHQAEGEWTKLPFAANAITRTCDLKKLETAQDILGTGPLAAGRYTMLRVMVTSAVLYFENAATGDACAPSTPAGRSASVEIPSGEVRLNRNFEVTESNTSMILLDFDGDRSVRDTGNGRYMMAPVIGIVSVQ
jgi:hypothetical protein